MKSSTIVTQMYANAVRTASVALLFSILPDRTSFSHRQYAY